MLSRILVAFVLVLLGWTPVASAATWYVRAGASPNTTGPANSCQSADLQAAITSAADGDTIVLGAGTCTWTTWVSVAYKLGVPSLAADAIAKWIIIQGAGAMPTVGAATSGGTTIVDNVTSATSTVALLLRESSAGNVTLANITVNTSATYAKSYGFLGWEPGPVSPGRTGAKIIVLHNMTFMDGLINTQLFRMSTARGLIYRNQFLRGRDFNGQAVFRCAISGDNGRTSWQTPSTLGSGDLNGDLHVYFEDNIINNYAQTSADAGCRVVYRGNSGENWSLAGHGKDSQSVSARQHEAYLNKWTCAGNGSDTSVLAWSGLRGAVQMVHNNTMDALSAPCRRGAPNGADIVTSVYMLRDKPGTGCFLQNGVAGRYPAPQQFGWGYITGATSVTRQAYDASSRIIADIYSPFRQDREGSYYWSNYRPDGTTKISSDGVTADGGIGLVDFALDTCGFSQRSADYVQENREWYKQNDAFTGSAGIGIGPRSSRPSTCTVGVAWWSTDQGGNWNTRNASANDGALDKCTAANTWTNNYYVPFPYPHPLTGEIGELRAPTGLTVK